jgi:outer membrane lipoprotein SlyB
MNSKLTRFLVALGAVMMAAACTLPSSKTIYDRKSVGNTMSVETGEVVSVREVEISGRTTIIGVGGGAVVGHAAGSGMGKGVGSSIAGAVGAVGGAVVGEALEEGATRKRAQEMTIKTSKGSTVAVVQVLDNDGMFRVGERVQIFDGGNGSVVRRLY